MTQGELIPHLFRTEFGKITAVLCKLFGIAHIEIAEDIASETFIKAIETWTYRGIPENPTAWLYTVARNKARNHIARKRVFTEKISVSISQNLQPDLQPEIDLSNEHIKDSMLQMLFAVCNPVIPQEAQIGLALRILCGFGIDEIAHAFVTNKETINKRLFRAKEKLRTEKVVIEFPSPSDIEKRLDAVLTTLYLLFNEGYYSETQDIVIQENLCHEAMRLNQLLLENERTHQPKVKALYALMCFHASRLPARKNYRGEIILYDDQDQSLWDKELITEGIYYLNQASQGNQLSEYHIEAAIAWWHTNKEDTGEKWENILQLYNHLLQISYSPIAALNRTFALSKTNGKEEAIKEAEKLQVSNNHYYHTLLGELYTGIDNQKAKQCLQTALSIANTQVDKQTIKQKLTLIE